MSKDKSTSPSSAYEEIFIADFLIEVRTGVFELELMQGLTAHVLDGEAVLVERVANRRGNPVTGVRRSIAELDERTAMAMVAEYSFTYGGRGLTQSVLLTDFVRAGLLGRESFCEAWKWGIDARNRQEGGDSPIVETARRLDRQPLPAGGGPGMWTAICPGRGLPPHRLALSAASGEFGCGYCRRRGGVPELEEWMKEEWGR